MQDRYVGDIGDYGKYGLLRELARPRRVRLEDRRGLRLGVVWCLTKPEGNTDGKHIQYLNPNAENQRQFRSCDPELYDALARIVRDHDRSVARVERDGILPAGTKFFSHILDLGGIPRSPGRPDQPIVGPRGRAEVRAVWVRQALEQTAGCEFVFFDPDNGLPTATRPDGRRGPKFIFYEDLDPFVRRGQTVIVYQHANRCGTIREQMERRVTELREHFGQRRYVACVFRRHGVRAFIVVPVGGSGETISARTRAFVDLSGWSAHFSLV